MIIQSQFAIKLLEKIGAPLAAAIESVPLEGDDTDMQAAKLMAQMLGQCVQASIALNGSLNAVEDEAQADSTRLALAAVAAPLIANFYRQNARVPEDSDIKKMVKSLEAVLAFAENFTPAEEGKSRLSTIDHEVPLFDTTQSMLVVMQVMTPVISAIAEFPFGQSENKLLQEVSDKLRAIAADIVTKNGGKDKLSELMILKSLAQIYTDCHRKETKRLASASDENRGDLSLDPIWEAFDTQVVMLETMAGMNKSGQTASPTPVTQPASVAPPSAEKPAMSAPSAETAPAATSGPMGFFKKPEAGDAVKDTKIEAAPISTSATASEPVASVSSPPVDSPKTPSSSPPSSPMGFFKPGAKKDEEDNEG